jgi:expansin (peptidoglycan-binding protein)
VRLVIVMLLGIVAACGSCSEDEPDPPAACSPAVGPFTGEGTYYDADGTGNCSFDASADRLVAAMNAADYAGAGWCGACVAVRGPGGEVTVRIVDQCPGCAKGDLDLSREAFAQISPLAAGRIAISWRPVPCNVQGPIAYQFKDGSNAFWTAIQIRNHRHGIAALEARDATGTYQPIARADYNYFVSTAGLGAGPFALRVTDTRGNTVEDPAIALGDAVARPGAAQFPACP